MDRSPLHAIASTERSCPRQFSRGVHHEPANGRRVQFLASHLITLHFWVWYPNPSGLYMGMNPMVAPFNAG
jgi:hypothetical protein